jgi:hypothetical protein
MMSIVFRKLACLGLALSWLSIQACSGTSGGPADGALPDSEDGNGHADEVTGDDAGWDAGTDSQVDAGGDLPGLDGDPSDGSGDSADGNGDHADGDGPVADGGDAVDLDGGDQGPPTFVAVTFNTGIHPTVGVAGFTFQQSQDLDTYYGHGLCWGPAIDQARAFFDNVQPDIVTFQEIFDTNECEDIPTEAREGFVCENWTPCSATVEELILGPGYQVACNWQKSDKCAAVKKEFGTFSGCSDDYCLDGLYGSTINNCGQGARIGRGIIDLSGSGTITIVNVHGSSGVSGDDMECREKQVEQVFIDLGDGDPAVNGDHNLVLGDFNTDPRSPSALVLDSSARRWADFVGSDKPFDFINEYVKTYENLFCIDNVVSDVLTGTCWYPGFTEGHPTISPEGFFDHTPTVCTIELP